MPNAPVFDTVSVEPITIKGNVYLAWHPVTSPGVKGYIIYRDLKTSLDNPNWENLDTVFGANNTSYIDITSNADGEYEFYILRSFTDDDKSLLSQPFSTIYTFPYIESENCKDLIRVHWDYHHLWNVSFSRFDIYCSTADGPYIKVGSVSGNMKDFKFFGITDQTSYSFFVRGYFDDGRTVSSNSVRTHTDFPSLTKYLNANFASVQGSGIKTQFLLDDSVDVRNYRIVRANEINGVYTPVYTINNYRAKILNYTDYKVNLNNIYYYKIQALNICGESYIESNIASNISLNLSSNKEFTQTIMWNRYFNWLGGDYKYDLYRIIEGEKKLIYTTFNANNVYIDNVSLEDLQKVSSKLCYEVVAMEGFGNPYGVVGQSKSNIICLEQEAIVHMPNAFTPNGDALNAIFKPTTMFVSPEGYSFEIFDRWGMPIFKTHDIKEGWDGFLESGKHAPQGTYVYLLTYFDFYNNKTILSDKFTLFRK